MANHGTIIRVSKISKSFGRERDAQIQVLKDIDLQVETGEFVSILGPTGCGKTTLLRILSGLESPDSGTIDIDSRADGSPSTVGFLFQQHALFPWMTVEKNILFGLHAAGYGKADARQRCSECLHLVGLPDCAHTYPYEISGGMQRRAALARTIAPRPDVILMDEPFSALDIATARLLYDEILDMRRRERITGIFVTHNIEEAVFLASRVIVMASSPGRFVADAPIDLPHPRDRLSEPFIGKMLQVRNYFEKGNL
ncbi:MAG: ABC transporter ATP-binding protein [Candidatus Omnitrophota bacterium]|jgi:NitT/TauT family transport system ATP-binding protein|nr:MAG: ABC transporter ATP-binding protein [Candidatus Omnitrophota bacterium]